MSEKLNDEAVPGLGDEIVAEQHVEEVIGAEEDKPVALPVMQVAFGRALAALMNDGTRVLRENAKLPYSSITMSTDARDYLSDKGLTVNTDPTDLDTVLDRNTHGVYVPAGVCVVMGKASVGKTPVLKWAVRRCNGIESGSGVLLRYGEPFPGYMTSEIEAASALLDALLDPKVRLIAIDSIKDLLASMDGAAMARGVPRTAFRMISQWGTVAAMLGKTVITPLNISTDNEDALAEVGAAVLSNSTCSVIASDNGKFDVLARTGEGKQRDEATWQLSFTEAGPVVTNISGRPGKPHVGRSDGAALGTASLKATQNSVLRAAGRVLSNPEHTR